MSEADAKALVEHLKNKNLIPKSTSNMDDRELIALSRKIQEETANYFNKLNVKVSDIPIEVEIDDEPIDVQVVKDYGEWDVKLTNAHKAILDNVEESFENLRQQLNLELEDYVFSPLFPNNPIENMQALQKCNEFESMLNQVPDCDKKLELKNKLQAMRDKLEESNTYSYQQQNDFDYTHYNTQSPYQPQDNFGYPDHNMQSPDYQNDIDMMNIVMGLDMLDDMNNGF